MSKSNHEEIMMNVESIVEREQGFIQRAACFSHFFLSNPDLLQEPDGYVNEFGMGCSFTENADGEVDRLVRVRGNCFEFARPLFDAFMRSVEVREDNTIRSEEEVNTYIDMMRKVLSDAENKENGVLHFEYEFNIKDRNASVRFDTTSIELKISSLWWIA